MASKDKDNKALGRGIGALFADVNEPASEEAVVDLDLKDIHANPYHPGELLIRRHLRSSPARLKSPAFSSQSLYDNRMPS
ncbi:hypothetical protein S101258_02255 [Lactiplantibacillus plantarum subsp. plantarum]|uniref:Chromosome partitioning protein ParB n=1 Tax=Lactiplantibacillus plantarum subsp. plantarum TaxID=337330 RepID=A0A2S3U4X3_LACPN|nr:hypothetical protein S101258_02255 [Lactiplantibacillus plantarum subsp. plantarum]